MEITDAACAKPVSLSPVPEDSSSLSVVVNTRELHGDVHERGIHDEEPIDECTEITGDSILRDLGIDPRIDNVDAVIDSIFAESTARSVLRETVRTESEVVDRSNPDTFGVPSSAEVMQSGSAVGQGPTVSTTRSMFAIDDGLNSVGPNGQVSSFQGPTFGGPSSSLSLPSVPPLPSFTANFPDVSANSLWTVASNPELGFKSIHVSEYKS